MTTAQSILSRLPPGPRKHYVRSGPDVYVGNGNAVFRLPADADDDAPDVSTFGEGYHDKCSKAIVALPWLKADTACQEIWKPWPTERIVTQGVCITCYGRKTVDLPGEPLACGKCQGTGDEKCDDCDGTGETECSHCGHDTDCEDCEGTGKMDCHDCDGTGKLAATDPCAACKGTGEAERRLVPVRPGKALDAHYAAILDAMGADWMLDDKYYVFVRLHGGMSIVAHLSVA